MIFKIKNIEILIDKENYDLVSQFNWTVDGTKYKYFKRDVQINNKRTKIYLHRFIMRCDKGFVVDHINGNVLDNRKQNLRICSKKENCRNANKKTLKGISIRTDGRKKKYCATIMVNYKRIYLGDFFTKKEAATAYDNAAKKYFGEFANLNYK